MKLVLFDIDGTLLRCGDSPKRAFDRAFLSYFSVPLAWGPTKAHGRTDPTIIQEIAQAQLKRSLDDNEYEELSKLYVANLEGELARDTVYHVLPGVAELLARLVEEPNVVIGIQTGNMEPAAWLKLRRGNLAQFFEFGGFGSDHQERSEFIRQAIARAERLTSRAQFSDITVIGDAPQDIRAGQKVGARAIAVSTGSSPQAELAACKPDLLLENMADTARLLKILL